MATDIYTITGCGNNAFNGDYGGPSHNKIDGKGHKIILHKDTNDRPFLFLSNSNQAHQYYKAGHGVAGVWFGWTKAHTAEAVGMTMVRRPTAATLAAREATIASRDATIGELKGTIGEHKETIAWHVSTIAARNATIANSAADVSQLQQENAAQKRQLSKLNKAVEVKDRKADKFKTKAEKEKQQLLITKEELSAAVEDLSSIESAVSSIVGQVELASGAETGVAAPPAASASDMLALCLSDTLPLHCEPAAAVLAAMDSVDAAMLALDTAQDKIKAAAAAENDDQAGGDVGQLVTRRNAARAETVAEAQKVVNLVAEGDAVLSTTEKRNNELLAKLAGAIVNAPSGGKSNGKKKVAVARDTEASSSAPASDRKSSHQPKASSKGKGKGKGNKVTVVMAVAHAAARENGSSGRASKKRKHPAPALPLHEQAVASAKVAVDLAKDWGEQADAKTTEAKGQLQQCLSDFFDVCGEAASARSVAGFSGIPTLLDAMSDAVNADAAVATSLLKGYPSQQIVDAAMTMQDALEDEQRRIVLARSYAENCTSIVREHGPWVAAMEPPDVCEIKDAEKSVRKAIRQAKITDLDVEEALAECDRDESDKGVKDARADFVTAQQDLRKTRKARDEVITRFAMLKQVHFPELKLNTHMAASMNSTLRLAGKISDNFDLALVEHEPMYVGRHRVIKAKMSGKEFALKEYQLDKGGLKTFEKEAGMLHRLQHGNIVELEGVLVDAQGTTAYLQTPLYAGGTLSTWLDSKPKRSQALVSTIMLQLAQAIGHLHLNDVIHSDIHPENIFIEERGQVYVLRLGDFDVSLDVSARSTTKFIKTGVMVGATMIGGREEYFAPEVAKEKKITTAADMWAYGIIMEKVWKRCKFKKTCDYKALLARLQTTDPHGRATATDVIQDDFFLGQHAAELEQLDQKSRDYRDGLADIRKRELQHAKSKSAIAREAAELQREQDALTQQRRSLAASSNKTDASLKRKRVELEKEAAALKRQRHDLGVKATETEHLRQEIDAKKAEHQKLAEIVRDVPAYWKFKDKVEDHVALEPTQYMFDQVKSQFLAAGATVTRVDRIENTRLWKRFSGRRHEIETALQGITPDDCTPLTSVIDLSVNECLFWHGTSIKGGKMIANTGFDERIARLRGLSGAGNYFAESIEKSMGYVSGGGPDPNTGEYCMLLCRVILGEPHQISKHFGANHRLPPTKNANGERYDSVVVHPPGAHREFIVYDGDQTYPEFMIRFTA